MRQIFNPLLAAPFFAKNSLVLAKGFGQKVFEKKPMAFSFNVSEHCPNNCKCYWRAQPTVEEWPEEKVIEFFKQKRKDGFVQVTLVGGEPYCRPQLLEKICGIIPFAWLVTSGTVPLRKLKSTLHVISMDGLRETHDKLRGNKGLYDRIEKNIKAAKEKDIGPIYLHTTLNHVNHKEIGEMLELWRESGLVEGIMISTMTPTKDAHDEPLRLSREERIWIVEELHRLKPIYGNFMAMTDNMIDRLHPDHTKDLTPENCKFALDIESYNGAGGRISPCVLSGKADCTQCGCVVTNMATGGGVETTDYFTRLASIK